MTNCMEPLLSEKTGVVMRMRVPAALPPKMNFASVLNAPSPLPAGLPLLSSELLVDADCLLPSMSASATSILSYLRNPNFD